MVTVTAAPAIPSDEPQWKTTELFTSAILNSTNVYRRAHNAGDVEWNQTLAGFASDHVGGCRFAHSGGPYGENLAEGYPDVTSSVAAWAEEAERYDDGRAGFAPETGHFTQLVWKNTTAVGCGRRLCGRSGWYLVCEYWPRGNIEGRFAHEVDGRVSGAERWGPRMSVAVMVLLLWSSGVAAAVG
ncbi:hypothetical protein E4U53_004824 [Claviceps sorghi]|nr:hypothetical protein E4U53_004824 [Claviceps sorghi]